MKPRATPRDSRLGPRRRPRRRPGTLAAHLLRHDHAAARAVRRPLRALEPEPREVCAVREGPQRLVQQRQLPAVLGADPADADAGQVRSDAQRRLAAAPRTRAARRADERRSHQRRRVSRSGRGGSSSGSSPARPSTASTPPRCPRSAHASSTSPAQCSLRTRTSSTSTVTPTTSRSPAVRIKATGSCRPSARWSLSNDCKNEAHVDPDQLYVVGFGQYHPLVPNDSPTNQAKNRRVDIVISPPGEKVTLP